MWVPHTFPSFCRSRIFRLVRGSVPRLVTINSSAERFAIRIWRIWAQHESEIFDSLRPRSSSLRGWESLVRMQLVACIRLALNRNAICEFAQHTLRDLPNLCSTAHRNPLISCRAGAIRDSQAAFLVQSTTLRGALHFRIVSSQWMFS